MAKAKKTWKLVLISVILSVLILAAFTAVFMKLIVPAYNITQEQIYSVMTRALPILIGLVFIEIALISSRKGEEDYRENIDKLAPNAYDSPLYTAPVDDPTAPKSPTGADLNTKTETIVKEVIKEVPVEVVREVVKEVPVEVIREVPVEVEVPKEVPVEVIKEVVKEVPVEVVKEVPVEVVKEVEKPVEVIKEVVREVPVEVVKEVEKIVEKPVEVIKEVEKPVEVIKEVVKEVPVEVIKEVEKPVEVIKEVEKEVEVPAAEEEVTYSFEEALKEEIAEAKKTGYPLTLVSVSGKSEEEVEKALDAPSFAQGDALCVILPYTRAKDVQKKVRLLGGKSVEMDSKSTAESMLKAAI